MAKKKKPVRRNPVPASSKLQLANGLKLFENFTGHDGEVFSLDKPVVPGVMLCVGYLDAVQYTTVRDSKVEHYIHKFSSKARPLLCASYDGLQLFILGGGYDFTERGIVDRKT